MLHLTAIYHCYLSLPFTYKPYHLNHNFMKATLRSFLLFSALLLTGSTAFAQLTGTLTVPSTLYPDLATAVNSLNTYGVGAGGVVINLAASAPQTAPGGGYRLGSLVLNPTLSATNRIVINGNGNTVTAIGGSGTFDGIFWLQGTDYVTINGLNLRDTLSSGTAAQMEYGYVLSKLGTSAPFDGCQRDSILNCTVSLKANNAASTGIFMNHMTPAAATVLSTTGAVQADANSNNVFFGNTINANRGIINYGIPNASNSAVYDYNNRIGGSTAASGNTFNLGGSTNTAWAIQPTYDSVLNIQNNTFSLATGHNGSAYFIAMSTGSGYSYNKGDLNIKSNLMNVACAMSANNIYCYYNYNITLGYGYNDSLSNFTVDGNTITGNNSTTTNSTNMYGFYEYYYCFHHTFNFTNNSMVNMNWGNGTGALYWRYFYYNGIPYYNDTSNVVKNITKLGTAGYLYDYFYNYNATYGNINSIGNIFKNITLNSYFYRYKFCGGTGGYNQVVTIKRNKVDSVDISGGSGYFYNYDHAYQGAGSERAFDTMTNVKTSTGYFYNYLGYYAAGSLHDCYFNNLSTTSGYIYDYLAYFSQSAMNIYNNTFTNFTTTSGGIYNQVYYTYASSNVYKNTFANYTTGTGSLYGLYIYPYSGGQKIYNNNINGMNITSSTSASIYGMYVLGGGAGDTIYNNFISGYTVPAAYSAGNLYGIYLSTSYNQYLYHNTIYLNPSGTGSSFGVTGIYYSSSIPVFDLRNNIININSTPGANNTTVALRRSAGTASTPPTNFSFVSGGNIYYTPTATNSYLYAEGTGTSVVNAYNLTNDPNFNTTCGLYKTFMARDLSSGTENNLVAGTLPNTFLPTGASIAKKGGVYTPLGNPDYAGVTRTSPPDAGALQFSGTPLDIAPPAISYTPLALQTYCTTGQCLTASITDATAVANGPSVAPRLYYKKSTESNAFSTTLNNSTFNGWKWVNGTVSGSNYNFCIDYSLLTAPIANGDSITYFVIAQDSLAVGGPNVGANLAGIPGCPTSVALTNTNALTNLPAANGYKILSLPSAFAVSAFYPAVCGSGPVTLSISPTPVGTSVQYQSATLTGAFANIGGATTPTYGTSILTNTTRFQAVIQCGSNTVATSAIDTVVVSNPQLLSTTGATRCGIGPVTLSSTSSTGATVAWYAAATGGTPLFTGNNYTTPTIGATTTYYAQAQVANGGFEVDPGITPASYSTLYPTASGIGLQFTVNNSSASFLNFTCYPSGSGTVTWELVDQTSTTAGLPIIWTVSVIGGSGISSPNVITVPSNNLTPGHTYVIEAIAYTGSAAMNYQYNYPTWQYPYNSPSNNISITNSWYYGATTVPYYWPFCYNLTFSGPCATSRVPVVATVTPAPAITAAVAQAPGICLGDTANFSVTSANGTYSYAWSSSQTTSSFNLTPTASARYVVTATDNTSGPYAGCVAKDSVYLYVNNRPNAPTLSPSPVLMCQGLVVPITATTGASSPILFAEGFEGGGYGLFTLVNSTNNTAASTYTFNNFVSPYTPSYGSPISSGAAGNHFIHADANAAGFGPVVSTQLVTTSSYNTSGYSSLAVTFNQYYYSAYTGDTAAVDVSSNNGATWTTVYNTGATGISSTQGTSTAFATTTVNLNAYVGYTNVKVRFRYYSNYGYGWALDSIRLTGTPPPLTARWTPVTGLYKNTAATTPLATLDTNTVVYASPLTSTVYTAKTNLQGCLSLPSAPDTVTVYPSPAAIITPVGNQVICSGTADTLSLVPPYASNQGYQWNLNGAPIVGATNASFPATIAGAYTLTITNTLTGCSKTSLADSLTLTPAPNANVTAGGPTTFCNGGNVVLIANSGITTGLTYQWSLNGSPIIPIATGATYTATVTGAYTVRALSTVTGCAAISNPINVTVNTTPTTITPSGSTSFCPGGSVSLCAPAPPVGITYTYQWNLAGSAIPTATNMCYTASGTGNYTATVTNTTTGCIATSNVIPVTNSATGPSSAITPTGTLPVCAGSYDTLSAVNNAPGLSYQWILNSTTNIPGATNATYPAGAAGSYTLKVYMTASPTCTSTTATPTTIYVNPLPAAAVTSATSTIFCVGNAVTLNASPSSTSSYTYQWKLNGTTIPGATGSSYVDSVAGSLSVTITNSLTGCIGSSANTTVTTNPLPTSVITASGPVGFCRPGSVVLNAPTGSGFTYVFYKDGTSVGTGSSYTDTASGSFTLKVTNGNGCFAISAPVQVTSNPAPPATISPAATANLCAGSTVTLTAPQGSMYSYQWKLNGGNVGTNSYQYAASAAGSYTVTLTNITTGCTATSAATVVSTVALPTASVTPSAPPVACDSAVLTANSGSFYSYQWYYNNLQVAGATSQSYGATQTGNYSVSVRNAAGCAATSPTVAVTVNQGPSATVTSSSSPVFCQGGAVALNTVAVSGNTYQWYKNSGSIPGATTTHYITTTAGNYTVMVTNPTTTCSRTSVPMTVVVNPLPVPVITKFGSALQTSVTFLYYQWYINTQPIAGQNGMTFTPTTGGTYAVAVTDANGCIGLSQPYTINYLGVKTVTAADISIYPNPTNGMVYILAPQLMNVILRDVSGKAVINENLTKKINLTNLADGMYFLYIMDKDGVLIKTEKVTKTAL